MPTLAIGSDHAAIRLRRALVEHLRERGFTVTEVGPSEGDKSDYPDQAAVVARAVVRGEVERGILCCGTGIGVSIAANKIAGVRAALVHDPTTARLAAQHNRANVLCMGGRLLADEYGCELADIWLETAFEDRHQRRLDKITALEGAPDGVTPEG
ncbi:MAG: ribose 5-phosphate isomerase B [Myxococcales bacterium]|nr:ribose 5-phosphate isomerase B [Myxococcales bacterium]MCB9733900.1 ribose 5-phosphate isomerase B [Deltaproteobacteria bacterium]